MKIKFLISIVAFGLFGCETSFEGSNDKPHSSNQSIIEQVDSRDNAEPLNDGCVSLSDESGMSVSFPLFMSREKIMITKFTDLCKGNRVKRDSNWMGMGFPCAGGNGEFDITGKWHRPKMLTFKLDVACPMMAVAKGIVIQQVNSSIGLEPNVKALTLNPFSVQFWQIGNSNDAGIGKNIEIRTRENLARWDSFKKGTGISITLFGQENSWSNQNLFYKVNAELVFEANNKFKLDVLNSVLLTPAEVNEAKRYCQSLKPQRPCHLVFQ